MIVDRLLSPFGKTFPADGTRSSMDRALSWSVGASLFLFPFSLLFLGAGLLPPGYGWTGTVTITLYALIMLGVEIRTAGAGPALATAGVVSAIFYSVEWIGMTTGFPFGRYEYTGVLTPLVAGVPVAIAAAWYSTLTATRRIALHLAAGTAQRRILTATLAGLLTVALDLLLEPFASQVNGYWLWEGGRVPFQNYAAWLVLATLGVWVLSGNTGSTEQVRTPGYTAVAWLVYSLQFALFSVTNIVQGHWIPVAAGILLAGSVVAAGRHMSSRVLRKEAQG